MSIFGSIMHKIFHSGAGTPPETPTPAPIPAAPEASTSGDGAASASVATNSPAEPVDVEAVCTALAAQKGGGGNWKTSIVDLLKLLDLDSSLDARKELAQELNVHVGVDGSAEENVALHRAVMQKLAENGGKVPDSLKA